MMFNLPAGIVSLSKKYGIVTVPFLLIGHSGVAFPTDVLITEIN